MKKCCFICLLAIADICTILLACTTIHAIPSDCFGEVQDMESYSKEIREGSNNKPLFPKEVFLTFDDGPSPDNTEKILKVLEENDVKATFFMIGDYVRMYPDIAKKVNDSGMSIGVHAYLHDYSKIYSSKEAYFKDMEKCAEEISRVTGREPAKLIRMPGGSSNFKCNSKVLKEIKDQLNEQGIDYVDWNVSSGDAARAVVPANTIRKNIRRQCSSGSMLVVLMHDGYSKKTTAEALPDTIRFLKEQGYVFRTFDDLTLNEKRKLIELRVMNRQSL